MKFEKETIIVPPPTSSKEDANQKACLVIISGNPLGKVFF
jgi:hypothetical protein